MDSAGRPGKRPLPSLRKMGMSWTGILGVLKLRRAQMRTWLSSRLGLALFTPPPVAGHTGARGGR